MVPLPQVKAFNASLFQSRALVAVFTAGLAGIGNYTLLELVKTRGASGAGLRCYIIGRKDRAAKELIAECRRLCPKGDFRYVKGEDLTLLRCVDQCCEEILRLEREVAGEKAKIDMLVMTQGQVDFNGRLETPEGLDRSMSLLYYSRIRFITRLSPLLTTSTQPSHIISIYAAGAEKMGTFHPSDLSLRGTNPKTYSFANCRTNVVYMTTMSFEYLAQQHRGKMALLHVWPGLVITPAYKADYHPWWFKILLRIAIPFLRLMAVSPEDIGQRLLFCADSERFAAAGEEGREAIKATDGTVGGGAYAIKYTGEDAKVQGCYVKLREEGFGERVVEHTMEAFGAVDEGRLFEG